MMLIAWVFYCAIADAGNFPEARFERLREESSAQAAKTRMIFRETRDGACLKQEEACLVAMMRLTGEFESLKERIEAFDRFTAEWERGGTAAGWSQQEKKAVRLGYSRALKETVVWVSGLDSLLNLSWGDETTRRFLDEVEVRLQKSADAYGDAMTRFTRRVSSGVDHFPPP